MRSFASMLLLLFAATACRTQLLDPPGPVSTPQVCAQHTRVAQQLTAFVLADPSPPTVNQTLRVFARVPLRVGCDVLGDVLIDRQIGDATDFVTVTAHVWRDERTDCAPLGHKDYAMRFPAPSNFNVNFSDGAPGGTATLRASLKNATPPADCTPMSGNGCEADCQCTGGATCLPPGYCAVSCNGDTDCVAPGFPGCSQVVADTAGVCVSNGCCDSGCGFGSCVDCRCVPPPSTRASCKCGADCPGGMLCEGSTGACQKPCTDKLACGKGESCVGGACVIGS